MLISETIERCYGWLHPGDAGRADFETLSAAITSTSATTFTVTGRLGSGAIPDDGVLEINSEKFLTHGESAGTVTVADEGRGWLNSTAATHANGDKVWIDPDFYREDILNAIKDVVTDLSSMGVYQRALDTSATFSALTPYTGLPATAIDVLSISLSPVSGRRINLREGKDFEVFWDTATGAPEIQFNSGGEQGNSMRILYAKEFTTPALEADDLTTTCGVTATLAPHIPMAAAGRLLLAKEPDRLQHEAIIHMLESANIPVGSFLNVGQALISEFERRHVSNERRRLRRKAPLTWKSRYR